MNNKSIIGFGYKPNNAKAVCLKTNCETRLGDAEYQIIADPYERKFVELEPVPLSLFGEKKKVQHTAMAINVLDSVTGLTYAVEYEPANLIRPPKEYKWGDVEILVGGRRLPVKTITRECERKPSKLIGSRYNPTNLNALDLETLTSVKLGARNYRIISEPYTKKYTPKNRVFDMLPAYWSIKQVWIKVLCTVTGRRYAVEFVPARVGAEPETPKEQLFTTMTSDAFLRRIKEVVQEVDELMDNNCELLDDCAVAIFAAKRNANGKTNGASLMRGNRQSVVDSMTIPARQNKAIADVIAKTGVGICAERLLQRVSKQNGEGVF